jgi:UDP-2,4-diacetamido-2,4,6-trideoxy-beta-L-altropyranose hydrolase
MNVAFRVDASREIGAGHVMRCLSLADALRRRGAGTLFVCRDHSGHLADRIRGSGHRVELLGLHAPRRTTVRTGQRMPDHETWLGAAWDEDAEDTIRTLSSRLMDWVVIDHYGVDARWEAKVRSALGAGIMVIDGQADRSHDCDVLLDQTYSAAGTTRWTGLVPTRCRLFVGPGYSLLRPEFVAARRALRRRDGIVRRLLIAFGGIDEPNATGMALQVVDAQKRTGVAIDVVAGEGNPHGSELAACCRPMAHVTLHVQPPDIAGLMAAADLAIGAGGTMMWERCYLGLPTIVVAIARNQIEASKSLHAAGAGLFVGSMGDAGITSALQDAVRLALEDPDMLRAVGLSAYRLMETPTAETPIDVMLTESAG